MPGSTRAVALDISNAFARVLYVGRLHKRIDFQPCFFNF